MTETKAEPPQVIEPTIGRNLLLFIAPWLSSARDADGKTIVHDGHSPLDVHLCYVHSTRMINIGGFDLNGNTFRLTSVTLRQPRDQQPPDGYWCEWMPYQQGKAAERLPVVTDAAPNSNHS